MLLQVKLPSLFAIKDASFGWEVPEMIFMELHSFLNIKNFSVTHFEH